MAERIPPHALSRASAWEWMGSLALLPIGYLLAGPAAEATQPGDRDGHRRDPHRDRAGNRPPAARHAHAPACRARFPRVTRFGDGNTPNGMRQAWLPATPEGAPLARAIVREATTALGLDSATTWELSLATTEAFANAVEHGGPCDPRGIHLRIEIGGRTPPRGDRRLRLLPVRSDIEAGRPRWTRHADHRRDHGRPRGGAGRAARPECASRSGSPWPRRARSARARARTRRACRRPARRPALGHRLDQHEAQPPSSSSGALRGRVLEADAGSLDLHPHTAGIQRGQLELDDLVLAGAAVAHGVVHELAGEQQKRALELGGQPGRRTLDPGARALGRAAAAGDRDAKPLAGRSERRLEI